MKSWLIRIGLWLFRFSICYIVLYFTTVFFIKPDIPDDHICFFCWLAALVFADHEEIKDMLDKNGKL